MHTSVFTKFQICKGSNIRPIYSCALEGVCHTCPSPTYYFSETPTHFWHGEQNTSRGRQAPLGGCKGCHWAKYAKVNTAY
mmetsp:Transcript_39099/g.70100  ORF Transcript_39099/g.70100 Transcript_39099/m.70100 type:complete len:80 (-) Transcript_39099:16-255(-)